MLNFRKNSIPILSITSMIIISLTSSLFAQTGVQLGSTFVPKEKIWVYVCFGNSALAGRDAARDTKAHERAWNFRVPNCDINSNISDKWTWIPAKAPLHIDKNSPNKGGPSMPFVKKMAEKFPDYHFGIFQHAGSANQMNTYQYGKPRYDKIIDSLKSIQKNVTIAGFISMFGLVEVQNGGKTKTEWLNIINTTVSDLREDLKMPNLPYIHSGYPREASGRYDPDGSAARGIVSAEPEISEKIGNAVVVGTDDLTILDDGYNSHYDSLGCDGLAKRVIDSLIAKKWAPLGSPITNPTRNITNINKKYTRGTFLNLGRTPLRVLQKYNFEIADIFLPNGTKIASINKESLSIQGNSIKHLAPGIYVINIRK